MREDMKDKFVKCTKCKELTWNDNFHNICGKPYCSRCLIGAVKKKIQKQEKTIEKIKAENELMREDIEFCLRSIDQERKMSKDEKIRSELTSCYNILKRWKNE